MRRNGGTTPLVSVPPHLYSVRPPPLYIHILFQFFFNMYVSLIMVDSVDSLLCENSNNTFCKYQLMGLTWLNLFFKVREGLKY